MVALKEAEYRHRADGSRVVTVTLYTDNLDTLPTSAADIDGMSPSDIIDEGSIALNMETGDIAMFSSDDQWKIW